MSIGFMLEVFEANRSKDAIVWKDKVYSYQWMLERIAYWKEQIYQNNLPSGAVTIVEADFSPNAVALFLSLVEHSCIIVPLTSSVESQKAEFVEISQGEFLFAINDNDQVQIRALDRSAGHELYAKLKNKNHPGLVLFSSGSTGKNKAIVHDLTTILEKFKVQRHCFRSITFLLFDHIGGVNTMLYSLSNAGCVVTVQDRSPDRVLDAVSKYRVELLPVSSTFINLILVSEAYKRHDISCLKTITYGAEPMPETTLKRFHELFPTIKLVQTYGLSEVGILRSKSKSSDSLWVKVGGEGFQVKVVDGILHIKAQSAMLGYLNAPSLFTEDGWFNTCDSVEVDGEYIKILGRKSEIITVGGEKVYPQEIENVIQEVENIAEVTVYGEKSPILGAIVCAKVTLINEENNKQVVARIKEHCLAKMQRYKVPVKVLVIDEKHHTERYKKKRV